MKDIKYICWAATYIKLECVSKLLRSHSPTRADTHLFPDRVQSRLQPLCRRGPAVLTRSISNGPHSSNAAKGDAPRHAGRKSQRVRQASSDPSTLSTGNLQRRRGSSRTVHFFLASSRGQQQANGSAREISFYRTIR
jgi:hypothetical protein